MELNKVMPEMSWAEMIKSMELLIWKVPRGLEGNVRELEGKVLDSFEELKDKFPSNENFGEVYVKEYLTSGSKGFDRYSRANILMLYVAVAVAYGCPKCNKIIIGPPEIKIEKWGNDDYEFKLPFRRHPLETKETLLYICKNCKATIDIKEYGTIIN